MRWRSVLSSRGDVPAEVRLVSAIIVPILTIAFVMLFVSPTATAGTFPGRSVPA